MFYSTAIRKQRRRSNTHTACGSASRLLSRTDETKPALRALRFREYIYIYGAHSSFQSRLFVAPPSSRQSLIRNKRPRLAWCSSHILLRRSRLSLPNGCGNNLCTTLEAACVVSPAAVLFTWSKYCEPDEQKKAARKNPCARASWSATLLNARRKISEHSVHSCNQRDLLSERNDCGIF